LDEDGESGDKEIRVNGCYMIKTDLFGTDE